VTGFMDWSMDGSCSWVVTGSVNEPRDGCVAGSGVHSRSIPGFSSLCL
jgi:hypothetical protein